MQTIGQILKTARDSKGYSLKRIEDVTKIKLSFIDSIEKGKWEKLPAFPTVLGFVKSLSATLGVDQNMAVAVLKRDYPPKKININPKPDVSSSFIWSPKLTFFVGVGIVLVAIIGYLVFQYVRFVSSPRLTIESPKEGQVVDGRSVLVFGSTDIDAKVTVNNQPVLVDADGKFLVGIEVSPETKEIIIKASSRSGKDTTVSRKINVE